MSKIRTARQTLWALRRLASLMSGDDGARRLELLENINGNLSNNTIDIPSASVVDTALRAIERSDWRRHFSNQLKGRGLEIGPLHRPLVTHDAMQVDYLDRLTTEQLRSHYPELADLPLVEPTIIGDAQTMEGIPDSTYDFVVSSHVIEHMRNPLAAVEQWCRITTPGGFLYLIVPDKRVTFDKKRVRTNVEHLILDYHSPSRARDFEHFLDYSIHVHDKRALDALEDAKRLESTDYSIHFHVFMPADIVEALEWFSLNVHKIIIIEGPVMNPDEDEFHLLLLIV